MGLLDRIAEMVTDRLVGSELIKSRVLEKEEPSGPVPPQGPAEQLQALLVDPFALMETMGYRERYSAVSYDILEKMAYNVPIYPAIMQTRANQIATFCDPEDDPAMPGYAITTRDREATPSKKQKIEMQDLTEWLQNTGSSDSLARDGFECFLRKLTRDSLIFDQACFEVVPNRKGVPCEFYCVDGASIRIADSAWTTDPNNDKRVRYVQVHDETVISEFTVEQLCFGVRNPRSDMKVNGYGMSELEIGLNVATSLINGFTYNSKFFTQGSVAKGMLNLPKVPDQKLRIFSRQWHMVISGVMNAWRTPITNFEDAKWIDLQKSNRDMEWAEFINFLIKLFCGICQIDPQELNFQYGNVGQTQALSSGAPAEEKVKASKDRGLRPLLRSIAYWINRWLIWRINPKYKLVFMGLDPREGETVVNIEQKQVSYLKTVNELRAENDLKPLPPDEGDLILNPSWIQVYQAKKAMEQQAQMGGPPGQDQGGDGQDGPPGQDQQGGDQQGGDQQDQGGEDQDWPNMMQDHLGKAHVSERKAGDTIEYEIDL